MFGLLSRIFAENVVSCGSMRNQLLSSTISLTHSFLPYVRLSLSLYAFSVHILFLPHVYVRNWINERIPFNVVLGHLRVYWIITVDHNHDTHTPSQKWSDLSCGGGIHKIVFDAFIIQFSDRVLLKHVTINVLAKTFWIHRFYARLTIINSFLRLLPFRVSAGFLFIE